MSMKVSYKMYIADTEPPNEGYDNFAMSPLDEHPHVKVIDGGDAKDLTFNGKKLSEMEPEAAIEITKFTPVR